jgi:hypothetical protein
MGSRKNHFVDRVLWWGGEVPSRCDRCGVGLSSVFVDCKTFQGPWGCFCVECGGEVAVAVVPSLCRVYQRVDGGWVSLF